MSINTHRQSAHANARHKAKVKSNSSACPVADRRAVIVMKSHTQRHTHQTVECDTLVLPHFIPKPHRPPTAVMKS